MSASASKTVSSDEQPTSLSKRQLLAFFAMIVGMFMAILDIQIVASSLPVIAAGLSASSDGLSWVQTSYLIAEVIVIPATGFLARSLSTRISFFVAATGFTAMSLLCAFAWNIESMILFRALQGFFGGAMIPTVFGIIYIIFPQQQRPTVTVIVGLVVTIAPTLGPTLGGYMTEIFSWHAMFLLNLIPGIFVSVVVFLFADFDRPNHDLLNNFDYTGICLMCLSLGSLQYVLEEGTKKDWFDDVLILLLSITSLVSFILLIIRELTFVNPILDFSAFRNKNFSLGCIYTFIMGIGLYGAVYLMPLFLFNIAGFNTVQIGLTMIVTGSAQFLSAPIAGKISGMGVDFRKMQAFGFSLFALGCHANSFLTPDSKFWELFLPQILRGAALMFCFIPVNNLALGTLSKSSVQNASGLFNLMRNLGGAIGLAAINTILTSKINHSTQYLKENISATAPNVLYQLKSYTIALTGKVANPEVAAYAMINKTINRDATIIAINEVFNIIAVYFLFVLVLIPFTENVKLTGKSESESAAH